MSEPAIDPRDRVRLKVNGEIHEGWKDVAITRSCGAMANAFDMTLTERWASDRARPIEAGDEFELLIGDDLVMTGHLDDVTPSFDAGNHELRCAGRSRTADLVDCAVAGGKVQWSNITLQDLAAELAAPYGVTVLRAGDRGEGAHGLLAADTGRPLPQVTAQEGDKVFDVIEKAAKKRGVIGVTDPRGRLVFVKPLEKELHTLIARRVNVLSAEAQRDLTDRFSLYVGKGQTGATGTNAVADRAHLKGAVTDAGVKRFRMMVVSDPDAESGLSLQDELINERNKRIGASERLTITLKGWRVFVTEDASEALWPVARRVRIVDPEWLKLDREMVIEETRFSLNNEGTRTQLTLVPTEAYDLRVGSDTSKGGGTADGVVGRVESPWDSSGWSREAARN